MPEVKRNRRGDVGTHQELDRVASLSANADIVLNAADADDLPLTRAIISGLKERAKSKPGLKPILLHTSGTGVIADKAQGNFTDSAKKVYDVCSLRLYSDA